LTFYDIQQQKTHTQKRLTVFSILFSVEPLLNAKLDKVVHTPSKNKHYELTQFQLNVLPYKNTLTTWIGSDDIQPSFTYALKVKTQSCLYLMI